MVRLVWKSELGGWAVCPKGARKANAESSRRVHDRDARPRDEGLRPHRNESLEQHRGDRDRDDVGSSKEQRLPDPEDARGGRLGLPQRRDRCRQVPLRAGAQGHRARRVAPHPRRQDRGRGGRVLQGSRWAGEREAHGNSSRREP